jgi:hypothetical protein
MRLRGHPGGPSGVIKTLSVFDFIQHSGVPPFYLFFFAFVQEGTVGE